MGHIYTITWECCGDSSTTKGYAPTECPFCSKAPSWDTIDQAFERGWCAAANWANREDLVSDIGSPAYEEEKKTKVRG